jgi:hypothetical protein
MSVKISAMRQKFEGKRWPSLTNLSRGREGPQSALPGRKHVDERRTGPISSSRPWRDSLRTAGEAFRERTPLTVEGDRVVAGKDNRDAVTANCGERANGEASEEREG